MVKFEAEVMRVITLAADMICGMLSIEKTVKGRARRYSETEMF